MSSATIMHGPGAVVVDRLACLDEASVCGASSIGGAGHSPGGAVCGQSPASHGPSHHGALAGGLSGDYLDPDHRTASDSTPCDCSFFSSATGVSLVSVHTHHLYESRWGFFRTPLKMSER